MHIHLIQTNSIPFMITFFPASRTYALWSSADDELNFITLINLSRKQPS